MELAYAGLQVLCEPIIDRRTDLRSVRRDALEKVFGLSAGWPPDRFLVGMAVLDLIATVAQGQPVVWIVDDAQWLDRSSVQTIGFVGRRFRSERVVIVIAARDTGEDAELAGLPELPLAGLSTVDAGTLLDSVVTGPTDPAVRDRIVAETPRESARSAGATTSLDDGGVGRGARRVCTRSRDRASRSRFRQTVG